MTELTPEKLREAADVVAAYAFYRREKDPTFRMVDAEILRVAANLLEAVKAERDMWELGQAWATLERVDRIYMENLYRSRQRVSDIARDLAAALLAAAECAEKGTK